MNVVNYAEYIDDGEKVSSLRPNHREYMDELFAQGTLIAGGPFNDGSGALFVYDVDSVEDAQAIVDADPFLAGGAFRSYRLAEWTVVHSNSDLLGRP
jgi:uncharacterized protein